MVTTLNKIPLNTTVEIASIHCTPHIKQRFLDLGFVRDTKITPILKSPSGDPVAFDIRGSLIAIREEETKLIEVNV